MGTLSVMVGMGNQEGFRTHGPTTTGLEESLREEMFLPDPFPKLM
jgi:hypothetical protein